MKNILAEKLVLCMHGIKHAVIMQVSSHDQRRLVIFGIQPHKILGHIYCFNANLNFPFIVSPVTWFLGVSASYKVFQKVVMGLFVVP